MGQKSKINIVLFVLLLGGGFWYLNRVFATDHKFHNTKAAFEQTIANNEVDVLFIGSSHVFTSTIPSVIDKHTKSRSFNFGSDGLRLELSSVILEEALKSCAPKLVAVEIFRGSLADIETDVSKGFQLRAFDFASNTSWLKFRRCWDIYNLNELSGVYSPFLRNHKDWYKQDYIDLDRRLEIDPYLNFFDRGYMGAYKTLNDSLSEVYKDFKIITPVVKKAENFIKPKHIAELELLVELSKKHDFELLLYTVPDLRYPWVNYQMYEELIALANKYDVRYINQNQFYEQLDLKRSDFKDASHLNFYGALKSSNHLGQYINEYYDLPDRSSEAMWKAEQEEFNSKLVLLTEGNLLYQDSTTTAFTEQLGFKDLKLHQKLGHLQLSLDFLPQNLSLNGAYILSVQVYPKAGKEDQLAPVSQEKGRAFDNLTFRLEDLSIPFNKPLRTTIKDIERLRIFIYDSDGYKGVVGEATVINKIGSFIDIQ
ncbi:hypothetical protein [Gilvibacter sediminis]|uniref:hypothetical protein n=1 Tax=Gilvibacter sediminis TaxID=379071 RepID=UPI002350265F|nr:hypothetical protein [Gilvibacter sediminis]MDC7996794.1 hypothetical protein [Gilvibacter sediminis]